MNRPALEIGMLDKLAETDKKAHATFIVDETKYFKSAYVES